ncbi:sialic acid-binding Ig-like lectin 13 isoform X2 [Perca fluviatilis]|uniref:sialic acid-binding Ig-like lectin 13 isoform X2 n=1 Tax=Perca fluviatilis TaxID=8168 RepID=UPI0019650E4A|nr:sialic acid-binding Ig-like lectin 13 isoform X2 [Perca fluviatilis]
MMSVVAVQSVKMVTANMLLTVFFVSGALADCRLQPGLFITAPQEMEALSGSCLIITCNFGVNISAKETFDSLTATFGVWIKNDSRFGNNPNNMIFNSSRMNNIYPMDITGDLSQKNCTTLFSSLITSYTDTYYFRFENWPFLATASCDPLQITVKGALAACSKDTSLFITAPKNMEALSGSCLLIPCNFSAKPDTGFNSTRTTFGVWIKNDSRFGNDRNNVIFNSSRVNNSYPMSITGDLSQKNCTTLFSRLVTNYTDTYYFRIENRPSRATAVCDPLQITVKDSPPRPRIEISGDLKEKESVTISCSASTPCPHSPPKLTWNLQQDPPNNIEENPDQTFTTKIQKTITLSDTHDGFTISCSATYPVNEDAPKNTSVSISPSGLVSAGSWVNLTCSSRAKPPANFSWFKNSKDGDISVAEEVFYSFNVTNVTDIEDYYCVATNDLGNQTLSWIHLKSADNPEFGVDVYVTVKILGILTLYSTLIIFECWLRSRCCNKPVKDAGEEDYVNRVIEIQAS